MSSERSLYDILGVKCDAEGAEIKRAYLRIARDTHPDKCGGDPAATERFQQLGRAYAVLRDTEKRKLYDQAGVIDDGGSLSADFATWDAYWRDFYSRVTTDQLDKLAAQYRHSAEEESDLLAAYTSAKGDVSPRAAPSPPLRPAHELATSSQMDRIMDAMMHATADDESRYREVLQRAIDAGSVRRHRAFTAEPAAKKRLRADRASREAAEAEEHAREIGLKGGKGGSLEAMILARGAARQDAMLDGLAAKYGASKGSAPPSISEEAFARTQQRMKKKK